MPISVKPVTVPEIALWRDQYRQLMNCQIIHDDIHARSGWSQPYVLEIDGKPAGYGSILCGGPWKDMRTVFEFYVIPTRRLHVFDLFRAFLEASQATTIEVQTNDSLVTVMLHTFARDIRSEAILFEDKFTTELALPESDPPLRLIERHEDRDWALESDGQVVASGGILYHYNRPYGDIYMKVAEDFRLRGCGSYMVQELKRICYQRGSIPGARCNVNNLASRKTLQKSGFVPCGHIVLGTLE